MRVNRRSFLASVLLGLIAFIPAGIALARTNGGSRIFGVQPPTKPAETSAGLGPPPPPPDNLEQLVIDKYVEGTVTAVAPDRITIAAVDGSSTILHFTPSTEVWEGRWVARIPIEPNDQVIVWGTRQIDGSLSLEKIWVNLVNLIGKSSSIREDGSRIELICNDRYKGEVRVAITEDSFIADSQSATKRSFKDHRIKPTDGQLIQVIGRQSKDGLVLATDVYLD